MKLNVTYNCNESWKNMSKTEKGKFCSLCNKEVIDFRNMSKDEIWKIHSQSQGKVCGLYSQNQIDFEKPKQKQKNFRHRFHSLYFGVLSLFMTEGFSQEVIKPIKTVQTDIKPIPIKKKPLQVKKDSIIISGIITDQQKEPLPGTYIGIKNTKKKVFSDFDGKYKIDVTEEIHKNKKVTLVYRYVGFKSIEKTIDLKSTDYTINVQLEDDGVMGEVIITKFKKPWYERLWNNFRNLFRKKE
ncbi:MAG: carboxypeptidase-like regulatory domain-containing protein [Flavobacteriaceae bacterium]|nr:carboxypeptidase-like regulatory domain-containing protein [Flavobacteriaceae bacterium]